MEALELESHSGFFLFIQQRNAREIVVEVSERCYRRHRMLGAGSPYAPSLPVSWQL
jgi:hypothetical protein